MSSSRPHHKMSPPSFCLASTGTSAFAHALPARVHRAAPPCGSLCVTNINKCRPLAPLPLLVPRPRFLLMTASPPPAPPSGDQDESQSTTEQTEKSPATPASSETDTEDDGQVSVWGVTSFAIIFAIFAFGIVATLARDFIPGGVTAPAPPIQ